MAPGGRPYDLLKLRYLLEGMATIGYDAVNLGRQEAQLDLEALKRSMSPGSLPFVSANLLEKSGGQRVAEPFRLIRRGPLRIGVTGVTAAEEMDVGSGMELRPPLEALAEV